MKSAIFPVPKPSKPFFLSTRAREQNSLCVPLAFPFTLSTTHKQTSLPKITFGMVNSTVAQLLCKVRWSKQKNQFSKSRGRNLGQSQIKARSVKYMQLLSWLYSWVCWPGLNSSHFFILSVFHTNPRRTVREGGWVHESLLCLFPPVVKANSSTESHIIFRICLTLSLLGYLCFITCSEKRRKTPK